MFNILLFVPVADPPGSRRGPVTYFPKLSSRYGERMGGGQALNVAISCCGDVAIQAKQQKIRDGRFVKVASNRRMQSHGVQRIAEQKKWADRRVIERFNAKMIPRAEQSPASRVPYRKRKIT